MSQEDAKLICGIVMPISAIDNCSESHWAEVQSILIEAIQDAGFEGNLVSNADDVGIIHKRIIQNLYDNPIVVCDVSGKNPNVMFELGLRLAFDKPTIIVKDDKTTYSFDTSSIEHLEYPRDLRFTSIIAFKQKLTEKIKATYSRATSDPDYTTFLKHFGEFKVAKLEEKEVSGTEFILDELRSIRTTIRALERNTASRKEYFTKKLSETDIADPEISIIVSFKDIAQMNDIYDFAVSLPGVQAVTLKPFGGDNIVQVKLAPGGSTDKVRGALMARLNTIFDANASN